MNLMRIYTEKDKTMATKITKKKFLEFERVRQEGLYNMFDPKAREKTNLTTKEWLIIMQDYKKLAKAWLKNDK